MQENVTFSVLHLYAVNEQIKTLTGGRLGDNEPPDEMLDRSEAVYVTISDGVAVNANLMIDDWCVWHVLTYKICIAAKFKLFYMS